MAGNICQSIGNDSFIASRTHVRVVGLTMFNSPIKRLTLSWQVVLVPPDWAFERHRFFQVDKSVSRQTESDRS